MSLVLHRHPASAGGEALAVEVDLARRAPARLSLRFRLLGDTSGVRLPRPRPPERTDELWRHTCFEAFVRTGDESYYEFNFSPSMQWGAYSFTAYRDGMAPAAIVPPSISARAAATGYETEVALELDGSLGLPRTAPWRLGLSAVIEDAAGRISYWALAHPPGKPDFHHPDSFALDLPLTES